MPRGSGDKVGPPFCYSFRVWPCRRAAACGLLGGLYVPARSLLLLTGTAAGCRPDSARQAACWRSSTRPHGRGPLPRRVPHSITRRIGRFIPWAAGRQGGPPARVPGGPQCHERRRPGGQGASPSVLLHSRRSPCPALAFPVLEPVGARRLGAPRARRRCTAGGTRRHSIVRQAKAAAENVHHPPPPRPLAPRSDLSVYARPNKRRRRTRRPRRRRGASARRPRRSGRRPRRRRRVHRFCLRSPPL